jgi:protein O-GlcNAc transferase
LSGYTAGTRLEVLAERVAPVQMTYLGYPGTLGVPYVDYLIADRVVIPEESRQFYSEEILYLPGCYLPRDKIEVPESLTPSRESVGLEKFDSVYCAFNHEYKITPNRFTEWMNDLNDNKKTALWIKANNEIALKNITSAAADLGIRHTQIVPAKRIPDIKLHLARYRISNGFYDTYPYGGHTTAADAYAMKLQVNKKTGKAFHARVSTSIHANNGNFLSAETLAILLTTVDLSNATHR